MPAYSSASTTKALPHPTRAVAGGPPVSSAGRSAPTNADGSSPAATSAWTSQPAVVLLPCVPATPTRVRPTAASATTCCHGSSGIPAVRAATSSGLSGSTAVSALVTARRSGRGAIVTWLAACALATSIPERLERRRVGRRTARIAAGDDGARTGGQDRRGARPGAGRADDVDPLALPDRPGRTDRCEAGPDPVRG